MSKNTSRILASIDANPGASDWRIAKNLGLRVDEIRAVRGTEQEPSAEKEPTTALTGGILLSHKRVLPRRPAESAAKFIRRLAKGRGFCPKALSQEWGMSEETIKRHAKELSCLKYVETSPDEWVQLIMSPETAAAYHA